MANEETNKMLENAYKQTLLENRIDKIHQKLFWYDNLPDDEQVLEYLREWRDCRKSLKELRVSNQYTV